MKTILMYHPEIHFGENTSYIIQELLHTLRTQGVPYQRNQTQSIVIGNTKVFFYDARNRNDITFVRTHSNVDVVFYGNLLKPLKKIKDKNLVFQTFLKDKDVQILSPNKEQSFLQLVQEIDEIRKTDMFVYNPYDNTAELVSVPVGKQRNPRNRYFELSEKQELLRLLTENLDNQERKIQDLKTTLSKEKKKAEAIFQSIGALKSLNTSSKSESLSGDDE